MKPVFEKTDNDRNVILTNKITTKHLIVGHNYRKEPIILTNEKFNTKNFKFTSINNLFTQSNSYNSFKSIKMSQNVTQIQDGKQKCFIKKIGKELYNG